MNVTVKWQEAVFSAGWTAERTTLYVKGIQPTFLTGLAALFSTFYTFNLQYQEEAACTVEFIQRLDTLNFR